MLGIRQARYPAITQRNIIPMVVVVADVVRYIAADTETVFVVANYSAFDSSTFLSTVDC